MTDLPPCGSIHKRESERCAPCGAHLFWVHAGGRMTATRSYCPISERVFIPMIICVVVFSWNAWAFLRRFTSFFQAIHRFFSRGKFAFLLRAILSYSAARFFLSTRQRKRLTLPRCHVFGLARSISTASACPGALQASFRRCRGGDSGLGGVHSIGGWKAA